MKSVSFAVEETNSSARTRPVHSTDFASGSVVNVWTSAYFSNGRASFAPGNAVPGMDIGRSGSLG